MLAPFTSLNWTTPPTNLPRLEQSIHLWRVAIDAVPEPTQQALWDTLSAEEQQRAERFVRKADEQRFIVGRGVLRSLLGHYCHLAPPDIQFVYNDYGKPLLKPSSDTDTLWFNLSHTEGWVVYAIAQTPIGIDLERIHTISQLDQIIERFFSQKEQATFHHLPEVQQNDHFFPFWTAKEAYSKAVGQGISLPLDQIDVALEPTPHFQHLPEAIAEEWKLRLFTLEEDYVGAIAFAKDITTISSWQWENF
ncbi:MAG: 4'-phosphopantetheinyl transferase superfamily protein [Cyanobacteria bacterium J06638_20]